MKTTRRKIFGTLLACIASPFVGATVADKQPQIITAGDPGSANLEVYDASTGRIYKLVQAVAVGLWIDQYLQDFGRSTKGNPRVVVDDQGQLVTHRVHGDFRVRPKSVKPSVDIFGDTRESPVPPKRTTSEDLEIQRRLSEMMIKFEKGL